MWLKNTVMLVVAAVVLLIGLISLLLLSATSTRTGVAFEGSIGSTSTLELSYTGGPYRVQVAPADYDKRDDVTLLIDGKELKITEVTVFIKNSTLPTRLTNTSPAGVAVRYWVMTLDGSTELSVKKTLGINTYLVVLRMVIVFVASICLIAYVVSRFK